MGFIPRRLSPTRRDTRLKENSSVLQQLKLLRTLGDPVIQRLRAMSTTEGVFFSQEDVLHQIRDICAHAVLHRSTRQGTTMIE